MTTEANYQNKTKPMTHWLLEGSGILKQHKFLIIGRFIKHFNANKRVYNYAVWPKTHNRPLKKAHWSCETVLCKKSSQSLADLLNMKTSIIVK